MVFSFQVAFFIDEFDLDGEVLESRLFNEVVDRFFDFDEPISRDIRIKNEMGGHDVVLAVQTPNVGVMHRLDAF